MSAFLVLMASLPVTAQQVQGDRRVGRAAPVGPMPAQHQAPAREANRQNREAPRDGRMTPEERQQLRRDVHDHGREIYRDRPGPGRR
ncbi:MAG: hypothetical protein WA373_13760 [Burkholderiales bacterium]